MLLSTVDSQLLLPQKLTANAVSVPSRDECISSHGTKSNIPPDMHPTQASTHILLYFILNLKLHNLSLTPNYFFDTWEISILLHSTLNLSNLTCPSFETFPSTLKQFQFSTGISTHTISDDKIIILFRVQSVSGRAWVNVHLVMMSRETCTRMTYTRRNHFQMSFRPK